MDEPPISEQERDFGEAYADYLAVGAPYPADEENLIDPERAARIRRELEAAWRAKVRRITRP